MPSLSSDTHAAPLAVIDIGSNSVRLVVYQAASRTPHILFNEKVLAGLGRFVGKTGYLDAQSMVCAHKALERFKYLCAQMRVQDILLVATAAVRDAHNGIDFLEEVSAYFQCPVHLLSGKEEAHACAQGVLSGMENPQGIVGDMGGGSLELVALDSERIGASTTLPLGSLQLQERSEGCLRKAEQIAAHFLAQEEELLTEGYGKNLYLVGGTWRSLGRLQMQWAHYPVKIIQAYTLARAEMLRFCHLCLTPGGLPAPLLKILPKERRSLFVFGAVTLKKILEKMRPTSVVFSAFGLREGILYTKIPEMLRREDPLLSSCAALARLTARSSPYARELMSWTDTVFPNLGITEPAQERRWRHAACMLNDVSWQSHPDYRAIHGMDLILNTPFSALDHKGRLYLALTIYTRYQGNDKAFPRPISRLLASDVKNRASLLAMVFRLAHVISASMEGILPQIRLWCSTQELYLSLPETACALEGESVQKRMAQLQERLQKKRYKIVFHASA